MTKARKITYWVFTLWLSLGMLTTGIFQVLNIEEETEFIIRLGYPAYILAFLGVTKILGVAAVLVPKFPLVKEWAYAGFFFTMAGAAYSHLAAGSAFKDIFPPLLLLALTGISWYTRPAERRLATA
jgi:hypothetical protein